MKTLIVMAAATLLVACSGGADDSAADTAAPAETLTPADPATAAKDKARTVLAQCIACHKLEKGAPHGLGPTLWGVYGTKAGELEGFNFSPAMKASGLTWDDATLDKYLENPRGLIPGNRMAYAGQKDPAKRKEMIEVMKTLKD